MELELEHEQLVCFSVTTGRTVKVLSKVYSMTSKVQALAVCAKAALSPYQGCSKVQKLGTCLLQCHYVYVFAVLMLNTTRGKH